MKALRGWLVPCAVVLLMLACSAPQRLSSALERELETTFEETEALEMTRPPPRPPTREPGRGGRNRNQGQQEARRRGSVFNAEPTREQRETARRRRENAAAEQVLRERYWKLKAEAEQRYPDKVGLYQEHHFWPRYLGGPATGKTFRVPAPYHQLITNAFREKHPYGLPRPSEARAKQIMLEVYLEYPIPQLIGIVAP